MLFVRRFAGLRPGQMAVRSTLRDVCVDLLSGATVYSPREGIEIFDEAAGPALEQDRTVLEAGDQLVAGLELESPNHGGGKRDLPLG